MTQEEFTEEEMREIMRRRKEAGLAYAEALQRFRDHEEKVRQKVLETTDKIYDIIVENQLSVRNVKSILDAIVQRAEQHSLVIVVDPVDPVCP